MQGKKLLTGIIAFSSTALICVTSSHADQFVWNAGDSNWGTASNWLNVTAGNIVSGYPDDASDTAEINVANADVVFDQTSLSIGELRILSSTATLALDNLASTATRYLTVDTASSQSGKLVLASGAQLLVGRYGKFTSDDAVTHEIAGRVRLLSVTSGNEAILQVNANTVFGPRSSNYGSITCEDAQAQIDIANGMTMTNQIILQGMGVIDALSGTATLLNHRVAASADSGVVRANDQGTLMLGSNLNVTDLNTGGNYPTWEVVGDAGAMLRFDRDAISLVGDFFLANCASINVGRFDVATTGELTDDASGSPVGHIFVDPTSPSGSFEPSNFGQFTFNSYLGGCN